MRSEPPTQKACCSKSRSAEAKSASAEMDESKDQQLVAAYTRIKAAFERSTKP